MHEIPGGLSSKHCSPIMVWAEDVRGPECNSVALKVDNHLYKGNEKETSLRQLTSISNQNPFSPEY